MRCALVTGVLTCALPIYPDAEAWDASQPYRIERTTERVLLPHPGLVRRIDALAEEVGADTVVLDPALPLGLLGPHLARPSDVLSSDARRVGNGVSFRVDLVVTRILKKTKKETTQE